MQITISDALAALFATDLDAQLNAGGGPAKIKLYTGSKPAKPDTAITTQTLLGTATCSTDAGTYAARRYTFSSITQDASADSTGTATWARFESTTGVAVVDVDCSTAGGSGFLQMNSTSVIAGGPISVSSCYIDF